MAKLSDKEVQKFFDEINSGPGGVKRPEPAFQRYRKHFLRDMDFNDYKNFSPEELIKSARTQEELFLIREEYLSKLPNNASGEPWWDYYHKRRIELGQSASLYDVVTDPATGKQRGLWGLPVDPEITIKQGAPSASVQHQSVNRRLFSRMGSWEQVTGQRRLFEVVEDGRGYRLKNWKGLKAPTLASNAPKSALIFDLETTGLLGQGADIISLGMVSPQGQQSVFAQFDQSRKYTGKVGQIVDIWKQASAGQPVVSERELVEGFIKRLENTGASEAVMGYNIKSFDLPKMYESAKKYGLHGRYEAALKQKTVIDVADYAKAFLSQELGGKYIGWEAGMVEEMGMNPLGWQLEAVAESLGYKSKSTIAHNAVDDAKMTQYVWKLLGQEKDYSKAKAMFNEERYVASITKHTGKSLRGIAPDIAKVNLSGKMGMDESKFLRSFKSHLDEMYPGRIVKKAAQEVVDHKVGRVAQEATKTIFNKAKKGAAIPLGRLSKAAKGKVTLGGALSYSANFVGTNMLFPGDFWQNALSSAAFEAARIGTKRYGTLKSLAAGTAANMAVAAIWYGTKGGTNDIAIREATNSLQFSGADDAYNTIQGLEDAGIRQFIRQDLTEFGSGYQGPNPWLNPAYNQAEEVERYKIMRASKLGLSESELYEYFTVKEEPSEYLAATASAGSALHLLEEAKAVKSGRVLAAEEFAYDPQAMITGHIDITYQSGAPADIKTVSTRRFEQIQQEGAFKKHIHQLNWYMHQKNAQTGYLEYINRDDTSQRLTLEIGYDPTMYERDMQKVMRVRRRVEKEIEAGILNKALLPKTASIETLQIAATQEAGEITRNVGRISYLEDIYKQEMDYLNTVSAKKQLRRYQKEYQSTKDRLAQGGQKISGKDDNYNTIEGLRHGGIAEWIRKSLTSFGSRWDPLRSLAKKMFKNVDDSLERLKSSSFFKEAIEGGKEIKPLGEGLYGSATLMETELGGQAFQYVRIDIHSSIAEKFAGFGESLAPSVETRAAALKSEFSALSKVSDRISPSPYAFDPNSNTLYMEYMSGETLNTMSEVPEGIVNKIREESIVAGKRGVFNPDIHRGNILYDKATDRVAWLDFGLAKTRNQPVEANELNIMQKVISDKISTPIIPAVPLSVLSQTGGFFEDWGDLVSSKSITGLSKETMDYDTKVILEKFDYFGTKTPVELSAKLPKSHVGSNIPGAPAITGSMPSMAVVSQNASKTIVPKSQISGLGILEEEARHKSTTSAFVPQVSEVLPSSTMPGQISKTVRPGTIPSQGAVLPVIDTSAETKAKVKRIKKFRKVSTDAVGIGHRAAYNAGRKHSGFRSTEPVSV